MSALRDKYPTLPALLDSIRHRAGMWIRQQDVYGLNILLNGWQMAEDFHELPLQNRLGGFDFPTFEAWVSNRYNAKRLSHNSFSLAEDVAGSAEAGFDLWFRWYDEYQADKSGAG